MMRKWNLGSVILALALMMAPPAHALSLQDKLSAWADASDLERLTIARALAIVASQGLSHLNEEFFESCIDFASTQTALQSRRIGEIGSMCVAMHFRLSEQILRP